MLHAERRRAMGFGWRGDALLRLSARRTLGRIGSGARLAMTATALSLFPAAANAQSNDACMDRVPVLLPQRYFVTPSAIVTTPRRERLILGSFGYDFGADTAPRTSFREDSVAGIRWTKDASAVIARPPGAREFEEPHAIVRADGDVDVLWFVTSSSGNSGVEALEAWTARLTNHGWHSVSRVFAETTHALIGRRTSSGVVSVGTEKVVAFAGNGRGPGRGSIVLLWYSAGRWRVERVPTGTFTVHSVSIASLDTSLALVFDAAGREQLASRRPMQPFVPAMRLMMRHGARPWESPRVLFDPRDEDIASPRVMAGGRDFVIAWLSSQRGSQLRWARLTPEGALGEVRDLQDVVDFTWVRVDSAPVLAATRADGGARLVTLDAQGARLAELPVPVGVATPTLFVSEGRVHSLQIDAMPDSGRPRVQVSLHDITCRLRPR